ncbi:hypothetical protein BH11BAC7_BH11BAC7_22320 [soil metagenome]
MDPEEITRLARLERKKQVAAKTDTRKPFNPLDWMDFVSTRAWIKKNIALSEKFYSFLAGLLLAAGLATWIYLQDEETWEFYAMIVTWVAFVLTIVPGFIYGFIKARKN